MKSNSEIYLAAENRWFQEVVEFLEEGNKIFQLKQNWDSKTGELIVAYSASDAAGKKLKWNNDWQIILIKSESWRGKDFARFSENFVRIDCGDTWEIRKN